MKTTIWTGACAAIVGAAAVVAMAQTPAPPQSNSASTDHKITVTGCLKAAPPEAVDTASTAGTAGTTGTTGSAGATGTTGTASDAANASFVLTNATIAPASSEAGATGSTAGSTAGTTGSAAGSTAGTTGSTAGSTAGTTGSTAGSAAGSAAESTGSQSAQSGQTYRLLANPSALSPHVGKKLELTGTLVNDSSAASAAKGPALRVESGKVIAASCQQ